MRILLIEDDTLLGDSLNRSLASQGYAVDWLRDGSLVPGAVKTGTFDLIVLDVRLPGISGLEILRAIRSDRNPIPVLLLTACDALSDKVEGLDAGADDYLTKPFEMDELYARVRSLLRRVGDKAPLLEADGLTLDVNTRTVRLEDTELPDLTAKEFAMLELLLRNRGHFVTKARLLESANNWDEEVESNTVEVYVSRLRKRIGHARIETLRGVGYRLK